MLREYGLVLAKLHELVGEEVEVSIRGIAGEPPSVAYTDGKLSGNGEIYGGHLVGYHRDALSLHVGELALTLHPDQFAGATWETATPDGVPVRILTIVMGRIELSFRAGPATSG